jgi:U2 small nuclear ribonucleoprotein A'
MPRLTADVLLRAPNYLNTLKEREICLRGYKVADIENLAVLQDQFDLMDLSDNELRALENFPNIPRLTSVLASNNYITRVSGLGEHMPNLTTLVLSNNRINSLAEIDNIASLTKLELLSLTDNQVAHLPKYRLYVIFRIPSLKCLDFQKVKRVEREEAAKFFSSPTGVEFIACVSSMTAGGGPAARAPPAPSAAAADGATVLSDAQKAEVRNAIQSANTREEVDIIETQLKVC